MNSLLLSKCFYILHSINIKMLGHSYLLCTLIRLHNNDFNLVFRASWQQNLSYDSYTAWKTGFFMSVICNVWAWYAYTKFPCCSFKQNIKYPDNHTGSWAYWICYCSNMLTIPKFFFIILILKKNNHLWFL